jgi:hypothetical protein
MRNTTKLKHILRKFTCTLQMDDAGILHLFLHHNTTFKEHQLSANTYSALIAKAYSVFLKEPEE